MSKEKEKKIRNPSLEELKLLEEGDIKNVEGFPINYAEKEDIDEDFVKPIDAYEPRPVKFRLPSGRTTVKAKYLTDNNEILVRRITTVEESMFKDFSQKDFMSAIEPQMDSCIKTNIPLQELSFIDKLPLYIFLLMITYGKDFQVEDQCEMCGKEHTIDIDLKKDILDKIKYVPDNFEYPRKIKLESFAGDMYMHAGFQTIGENNLITEKGTILDQMMILIKKVSGLTEDGKTVTNEDRENIIKYLNDKDRKKFRDWIIEFSEYGTDLMIHKKVCKNNSCELYDKKVERVLPLVGLMMSLIKRIV